MGRMLTLYRYMNLLSLDVVAGAVVSAIFFSHFLGVRLLPFALIALGLTVWIIYTADHLRDAMRIGPDATSDRHAFHYRHSRILTILMLVAAVADALVIFYMRKPILTAGLALSLVVGVYLLVHRYLRWAKEIVVAVLYTTGVLLPAVTLTKVELTWSHAVVFFVFALSALVNLLILSWFDHLADTRDRQDSFSTVFGQATTQTVIYVLMAANFSCLLILWFIGLEVAVVGILAAMNGTLLIIFLFPKVAGQNNVYRLFGDLVFLFPLVYVL